VRASSWRGQADIVAVLELLTFQLVAGADEAAFLEADKRLQSDFAYQQPGWCGGRRHGRRRWVVVVDLWRRPTTADACDARLDDDRRPDIHGVRRPVVDGDQPVRAARLRTPCGPTAARGRGVALGVVDDRERRPARQVERLGHDGGAELGRLGQRRRMSRTCT